MRLFYSSCLTFCVFIELRFDLLIGSRLLFFSKRFFSSLIFILRSVLYEFIIGGILILFAIVR